MLGRQRKFCFEVSSIAGDFFNCIRNGGQPCSNFVYAGRLTEIMHLGNIAARVGEKLTYNFKALLKAPSIEEVALLIMALFFIGFAFDWAMRILGVW